MKKKTKDEQNSEFKLLRKCVNTLAKNIISIKNITNKWSYRHQSNNKREVSHQCYFH